MRTRARITIAGLVLGIALVGSVAWATIPDAAGVINGCYRTSLDDQKGQLRIVDDPASCRSNETAIQWNQEGPKGDTGAQGIQGIQGDTGATGAQGLQGDTGAAGTDGTNGVDGEDGQPGLNGTNGDDGIDGTDGRDGSDSASAFTGRSDHIGTQGCVDSCALRTMFAYPEGRSETFAGVEEDVVFLSPNATIVARDLAVDVTFTDPEFHGHLIFTIRDDGVDTAVSCTIPGNATTCNSGTSTATIAPGSKLSLKVFRNCVFDCWSPGVRFGWRATTP